MCFGPLEEQDSRLAGHLPKTVERCANMAISRRNSSSLMCSLAEFPLPVVVGGRQCCTNELRNSGTVLEYWSNPLLMVHSFEEFGHILTNFHPPKIPLYLKQKDKGPPTQKYDSILITRPAERMAQKVVPRGHPRRRRRRLCCMFYDRSRLVYEWLVCSLPITFPPCWWRGTSFGEIANIVKTCTRQKTKRKSFSFFSSKWAK